MSSRALSSDTYDPLAYLDVLLLSINCAGRDINQPKGDRAAALERENAVGRNTRNELGRRGHGAGSAATLKSGAAGVLGMVRHATPCGSGLKRSLVMFPRSVVSGVLF